MLFKLVVDPDIFSEPYNITTMGKHRDLIQTWRDMGVLIMPDNKDDANHFRYAIDNSPEYLQKMWKEALKHHRKISCHLTLLDFIKSDTKPIPSQYIPGNAVSLSECRALLWGLDDDKFSDQIAKDIEICHYGHENKTATYAKVNSFLNSPIAQNESTADIWNNRIKPQVELSRTISIVDRFALKEFINFSRNARESGLVNLINKISFLPDPRYIRIYSSHDTGWDLFSGSDFNQQAALIADELYAKIKSSLGRSIKEISINILPDSEFKRICHYRYIKYDNAVMTQFDVGLEPLNCNRESAAWRTCTIRTQSWLTVDKEIIKNDESIQQNPKNFRERFTGS